MGKHKRRKPPEMPVWWWIEQDGCWFCKDRNGCSGCGVIKKDRKLSFGKKFKGRNSYDCKKQDTQDDTPVWYGEGGT